MINLLVFVVHFFVNEQRVKNQEDKYIYADYQMLVIDESEYDNQYILSVKHIDGVYKGLHNKLYLSGEVYHSLLKKTSRDYLVYSKLQVYGRYESNYTYRNPGGTCSFWSDMASLKVGKLKVKDVRLSDETSYHTNVNNKYLRSISLMLASIRQRININNIKYQMKALSYHVREGLKERIKSLYDGDGLGIIMAMFIGDKQWINSRQMDLFRQHGISHIIAISGLHIGILYLIIFKSTSMIFPSQKTAFLVSGLLIGFYNIMLGLNISGLRASVMVSVYYVSLVFARSYDKKRNLFLVAMLNLFLRPWDLFSVAFQLSYGAVCSLYYILPVLQTIYKSKLAKAHKQASYIEVIVDAGLVTLAVNLGSLPILVSHFGGLSMSSVIANILIVPLVFYLYVFAMFNIIVSYISLVIGRFLAASVEIMVAYVSFILVKLDFISYLYLKKPDWIEILIYYTLLLLAVKWGKESLDHQEKSSVSKERGAHEH